MINSFQELGKFCNEAYGSEYNSDEEYFICPECAEVIYADDWNWLDFIGEHTGWRQCPICGEVIFPT